MRRFCLLKKLAEFPIKKLYYLSLSIVTLLTVIWIFDLLIYAIQSTADWQLLEPAENENLVLTWAIKYGYDKSIQDLLSHGILPIYPDFYHRVSALLPLDAQSSGRFLSLIAYFSACLGIYFFAKKRTRSWIISCLFVIVLFGSKNHAIYFLIQRPDSLYISLGIFSLLIAWWNLNAEIKLANWIKNLELWRCFLSGLLLGLAMLSKQTAVIFAIVELVPFIIYLIIYKKLDFFKPVLIISSVSALTVFIYFKTINSIVFYEYNLGLDIFGRTDLHTIFASISNYYFPIIHNGYLFYFLAPAFAILNYPSRECHEHQLLALGVFGAMSIATIKMWANSAAHSNNFILISIFGVLFTLYFWPKDKSNLKNFLVSMPLIIFAVTTPKYYSPQLEIFAKEMKSVLRGKSYLSELANPLKVSLAKDPIFDYVLKNPGHYITTRLDNYLIYSNSSIEIEGSVSGMFVYMDFPMTLIDNEDIRHRISSISNEVRSKIKMQYYDGILLGIQTDAFKKKFPELIDKYVESMRVPIKQGTFEFDAVLYLRRI